MELDNAFGPNRVVVRFLLILRQMLGNKCYDMVFT
jgi:hypothetical protein